MPQIELIGGPYDGASGPCRLAGEPRIWAAIDPERRERNGLLLSRRPGRGSVGYWLTGRRADMFVYEFDLLLDSRPVGELEAIA